MDRRRALETFLTNRFNSAQLRQLLTSAHTAEVVPWLPGMEAPHRELVHGAVAQLHYHNLLDGGFFDELARARPQLTEEITQLEAAWDGDSATAALVRRSSASARRAIALAAVGGLTIGFVAGLGASVSSGPPDDCRAQVDRLGTSIHLDHNEAELRAGIARAVEICGRP